MKEIIVARSKPKDKVKEYEKAIAAPKRRRKNYVLRLYIAGMTPASQRAVLNVKEFCDANLEGRYDLEVIDIYQQPTLGEGEQIIAAPTLIKKLPLPLRKFIGDLSDRERLFFGLDVRPKGK